MNKYLLLILLAILSGELFGQNTNALFFTYSRSLPRPVYNRNVDGGAGYKAFASNTFGFRYFIKSSKIITLETGIDYSSFNFKVDYAGVPNFAIPDITRPLKIISVPVYAHLTFLKYIFVNGGLLLDAQLNPKEIDIDRQTGIGLGLGVGLKYNYKHIAIFINPFVERTV
ncbi:hypothetical protein [Dyadobacter sp. CY347]|uniref:hypothetical protein n=1 Tax=Dyadobacter sp. CY347 TaxID=2909336 RepID=UPI001F2559A5|nr:hypothetical protein [Dyadobacter sp. CY347]MCF2488127.1 hypothetical protein [Dyadobacter sp. CY347]